MFLLAVSADRRWSDLPLSPFFLPLVHQFIHYAAGTSGERTFQWTARELEVFVNAPALRGPDAQPVPIRTTKQETTVVRELENAWQPGIYRLGEEPVLALNFPRAESDLTPLESARLPLPGGYVVRDPPALARVIEQHRLGRPLSETVLWVVLGLALLELFLANRAGRPAAKLTDRVTIHPSGRVLERVG